MIGEYILGKIEKVLKLNKILCLKVDFREYRVLCVIHETVQEL